MEKALQVAVERFGKAETHFNMFFNSSGVQITVRNAWTQEVLGEVWTSSGRVFSKNAVDSRSTEH